MANKYIEQTTVLEIITGNWSFMTSADDAMQTSVDMIRRLPAADVRPVVLCRDCKHRFNYPICAYHGDDWFCGYGEKREES